RESAYSARVKSVLAWAYALSGQCQVAERLINEVVDSGLHRGVDPRKLLPSLWLNGPLHADQVIARCEALLRSHPPLRTSASCHRSLAAVLAARGRFDEAHALCDLNQSILDELGLPLYSAASTGIRATVYSLAGRLDEAEGELREGMRTLKSLGDTHLSAGLE